MEKFPITSYGFTKLVEELRVLKSVDRPAVVQAISEARALGDLSENAEYHAAREKQAFIEGRIIELEDKVARADVIDTTKLSGKIVKFGASVTLSDDDTDQKSTYCIVGEYESDIASGLLSVSSPLARALIGKEEGDNIEVYTPKGQKSYAILQVSFSSNLMSSKHS
jgi:transcription elongation factor GreA